jgi:quercetin dioxygenase-like cupin family protein
MKKSRLIFAAVPAVLAAAALAQANLVQFLPDQIKWTATPPGITQGAQSAVLSGPLDKANPYTQRVRLAAGGMITPHTHPDNRYTTVLSGELYAGLGEAMDAAKTIRYPAGTFFIMPAGQVHYSWARNGEVTYQESGMGPTGTNFLKK